MLDKRISLLPTGAVRRHSAFEVSTWFFMLVAVKLLVPALDAMAGVFAAIS